MPEEFGRQANPRLPVPRHEPGSPEFDAFHEGYVESVPAVASGTQPINVPKGEFLTYREKLNLSKDHVAMITGQVDSVTVWAAVFFDDHLTFHKCVLKHDAAHGQYLVDA